MIKVSENIQLKEILKSDSAILFRLMSVIYPQAYSHFWEDSGDWYVKSQYNREKILQEISQINADYYFVLVNDEIIGNYRVVWDEKLEGLQIEKQVKLHRIYLHQKTHGKGIGKKLLLWLEEKAKHKGYNALWLDAMDAQPQAFQFYKKFGYKYHSHWFLTYELMYDKVRKMSQVYKKLS